MTGTETRNSGRNVSGRTVRPVSGMDRTHSSASGTRSTVNRTSAGSMRSTAADNSADSKGTLQSAGSSKDNKGSKKPRRATKKQVRRTVAGLFLASAVIIAAIPTPEVTASYGTETDHEAIKVSVVTDKYTDHTTDYYLNYLDGVTNAYNSDVPFARPYVDASNPGDTVYTSDSGLFQFVYINPTATNPNKVAVILGYNGNETSLTIPDTLEGFRKYKDNDTSSGYCLVAKSNEFLHYRVDTEVTEQKTVDVGGGVMKKCYIVTFSEDCVYDGVNRNKNDVLEINEDSPYFFNDPIKGPIVTTTKHVVPTPYPTADDGSVPDPSAPDEFDETVYHTAVPEMITRTVTTYLPCYAETRSEWGSKAEADLYYYDNNVYEDTYGNPIEPKACGANTDKMRINADVAYIGQQSLKDNGNGTWSVGDVITSPNQGVFAENPSLTNLTMGSKIVGIGDFAFKGCSTLTSVDFGPSLRTIGNGAFAECIRLTNCNIASNANIRALGKDAFYQCRTLTSFTTNIGLEAIGDSCFEDCIALSSFYFADGGEVALKVMGNHVFRGCTGLAGIEFPASYSESTPLEIDMFEGCTNLQYVKMNNDNLDFDVFHKDTPASYPRCTGNNWDKFKDTVPDEFYFEGRDASAIHQTCKDNSVAFKYYDEDRYERKVYEIDKNDKNTSDSMTHGAPDASGKYARTAPITYQINSQGQILSVAIEKRAVVDRDSDNNWHYTGASTSDQAHPINLTIPEKIGPFGIDTIGDGAFENNCYITKVTIPATVTSIGSRAFAGCHNLETVIFSDAKTVSNIGTDAFKTQDGVYDVVSDKIHCSICKQDYTHRGKLKSDLPELTFCGEMLDANTNQDTVPFVYAMNGQSNINNSDQITSWIKYHSGWPTNLVVQYDYDAISGEGEVTLVDYPRYTSYTDSYSVPHYGYDDPSHFVESLPYIDKDDDPDKYQNYLDLVTSAVSTYNAYKTNPKVNPAPTEQQMTLINAALNIVVPNNVDAIKEGIFSGAGYDNDGYPVYFVKTSDGTITGASTDTDGQSVTGYLIYTDDEGNLYTDENKTTTVKPDEVYLVKKEPFVKDAGVTNTDLETITLNGVDDIDPFAFSGNTALREASLIGPQYVGDYAFDGCVKLANTTLGSGLSDTGLRPFRGCTSLTNVNSLGSNFTYSDGIIYKGNEVVECLEGRGNLMGSYSVGPGELAGVTSIRDEAFMNCDSIGKVDLSTASVDDIPFRAFRDADSLNSVILGSGVGQIKEESFYNTPSLKTASLPYSLAFIAQDAFSGTTAPTASFNDSSHKMNPIIVSCVEGSTADKYAKNYVYMKPEYGDVFITHNVFFWDNLLDPSNAVLLGKQLVNDGEDATPPEDPSHAGYVFNGWTNYKNIVKDTDVYALFSTEADPTYTVKFLDYDGTQIGATQTVSLNKSATKPADPTREGYTFTGWKCTDEYGITYTDSECYNNITSDRVIVAQYKDNSGDSERHTVNFYSSVDQSLINTQKVNHGEAAVAPQVPTVSGYTFKSFIPSTYTEVTQDLNIIAYYEKNSGGGGGGGGGGGESGTATPTPTNKGGSSSSATATPTSGSNNGDNTKKYTVTVSGGSGTGSYAAGAIVPINAYDMGSGQTFDKWTTSTAGVGFASATSPSTYFVMPANNVAVTATYKAGGSGSAATTGSGGTNSGNGTRTATANPSGNTQVDITKSGISNRNVAGATVSGSTDNFIVKITDDQHASDMALQALQNAYGDITRVKYLPMDISLYDSTGRTKITDTQGLAVGITMPLPDELAPYAGNNKIASTENGTLDNLNSRFTTVDGVPCISFTATHFSPYVIYVDTANLTETTIDYTPKTGDPIHPKWFLSIGLAAAAVVLFFMKDKKAKVTPA